MTTDRTHKQKRRSWRSVVLLTLLLLVGGAVVNVAVAWTFALWHPSIVPVRTTVRTDGGSWLRSVPNGWPTSWSDGGRRDAIGFTFHWMRGHGYPGPSDTCRQVVIASGIPLRSLCYWSNSDLTDLSDRSDGTLSSGGGGTTHGDLRLTRYLPWLTTRSPRVPLGIIWPGFAVNTVFYAGLLWLPIRGPFVVRRWRRKRRGLCVVCGYDLRGSPTSSVCPESGERW